MKIGKYMLRALVYLRDHGPQPASMVGCAVWFERPNRRATSMGGGGDYGAQMLLGRMKAAGLVAHAKSEGSALWELTWKGRKAASA